MFTLRQLRYFIAVAETGKISEAAASIYISPSSITEAIKELEKALGTKLLERTHTGMKLTMEGYRFLKPAKKVLAAAADAQHSFQSGSHHLSGSLILGSTVTVSGYFLSGILERFRRTFPKIDIGLHEHSRVVIERKIDQGEFDIGIVLVSNVQQHASREILSLLQSQRHLWIWANHHFANKTSIRLADVAKEPYIQLLIDEAAQTTHSYWQQYRLQPQIIFKSESVEAVRSLVATGAGVTILSDMVYRPWSLEGDRIETRPIEEPIPSMDTGLIWSTEKLLSPQAKAFVDFCRLEYTSNQKTTAMPDGV